MDSSLVLKKLRANAKLEKLILQNAPKEKILKQSKLFDKYMQIQFKQMNKYREKKLVGEVNPNY